MVVSTVCVGGPDKTELRTLSWQELRASDLSGRARAFQSMVGGGMPLADAVAVAGLMVDD